MEISYLYLRRNRILLKSTIVISLWFLSLSAFSQSWNLVWREDFGVAEDTVIKDFPDPSMTVPNHHFYTWEKVQTGWDQVNNCAIYDYVEGDDCGEIADGFYGIANSTWWAYNRFAKCNKAAGYFTRGRDHTGNDNGAMLIINSGAGVGEVIYSQDINFQLCDSRQYRFAIYSSSITSFTAQEAMLTLKIINKKTNTEVGSIETQEIPLWGYAGDNPHAEHEWSYYYLDFTANDGDELSLQVINNSISGTGNDFVLDDISLFRNDEAVKLPDLEIAELAIASQTGSSNTCSYSSTFSLPTSVLDVWKTVYDRIYFLWQKSDDGGLSWKNMTAESGIEKMKLSMDIDGTETGIYRVIVTGGSTDAIAESQALYIAEHGAPENGCEYYSISNTLSSVKPEPNCKYKENLKTVWNEDFGVCDSFSTRSVSEAKLNYYESNSDAMTYGDYVVCSRPDTAIYKTGVNWDGSTYVEYTEKNDETRSMKNYDGAAGGAFLFVKANKQTKTIYEKTLSGLFCNCKAYMFNFNFYKPNNWSTIPLSGAVLDKDGNVLGEASVVLNGGSGGWAKASVPFELPIGYTGNVTVRISYCGTCQNADDYARFIIDNLSVTMCGETAPQGKIGINKDITSIFQSGFDCADETIRTIDLFGLSEWNSDYPNAGFVWQSSLDGGQTWSSLPSTSESINYESNEGNLILYRAIIGETTAIAQQVAAKGKPDDGCSLFFITNTAGLQCKVSGCKAPIYAFSSEDTLSICSDATDPVTLTVEQTNHVNVDEMQWYSAPAGTATWTAIAQANDTSLSVLPTDSTDYLFISKNDTCFSDSIFARININKAITIKQIQDSTLCENSDITLTASTTTGYPTLFIWNGESSINPEFTITGIQETKTITLSATDGVCQSAEQSITISKEDSVNISIIANKNMICSGDEISILTTAPTDVLKTYTFSKTTDNDTNETLSGISITENLTETTRYILFGKSTYCPEKSIETTVIVNKIPTAPIGTKKVSYLKSDGSNGIFKNILTQNPDAIEIETGYTYTWYDKEGNELTDIPTPAVPSDETTADIYYTYYVERTFESGCTSQRTEVTVTIYSSPAPSTSNIEYCLEEEATPLTATISTPEGTSSGNYELIWYTDLNGSALATAPTPNTSADGTTTYYVSQRNKTTLAESSRVPLTVTVYEVGSPTIDNNRTSYCKDDNAEELKASISGNGQSLTWLLNGEETTSNSINTNVTATSIYKYNVHQTYTLSNGNICVGKNVPVDITVTYVAEPQGNYSVNYIRLEEENNGGIFADNLLQKDPSVATADEGCVLIWYDADKNEIGGEAPTPKYDASWPKGTDINLTYFVAQKNEETGCIGNAHEVTVTISDSPMPKVSTLNYCVGDNAKGISFGADLEGCAEIQTLSTEDAASNYELVWFSTQNEYKEHPSAGSSSPTIVPNTDRSGEQKFYVCQRNKTNLAMSTPSEITIIVHGNPQITTATIPSQCSYDGATVSIDLNDGLDQTNDEIVYTTKFYADINATTEITDNVNSSGSYYVQGSYEPIAGLTCRSEIKEIKVDIQDLSTPIITADQTVCPASILTLKAEASSSQTDATISYVWNCNKPDVINSANGEEISTNALSDEKGTTYNFTVTASMGACTSIQSMHQVTVGDAPLVGTLTVKENDNSINMAIFTAQSGNEIYTCGGSLTFSADFAKSEGDYTWSTGSTGETTTTTQSNGDKTYKVGFINKCPTFVEFTVHAIPLTITEEPTDFTDCEGASLNKNIGISCEESNYEVEWSTPNGMTTGQGADALSYNIVSTSKSDNGTYSYSISNRNCSSKGSFDVKIKEYIHIEEQTAPYIVAKGEDKTISLNITNGVPKSIEWTENGSIINTTNSLSLQNVTSDHSYNIHISDPNYCDAQTSVNVWVDAAITMEISLTDSLCYGETTTLVIDTTGTGTFRQNNVIPQMSVTELCNNGSIDLSSSIYYKNGKLNVDISPKENANYTVEYTYGSQSIKKNKNIIVLQPVSIQPTVEQSVCSGDEVTLSVSIVPNEASVIWDNDNTISSSLNGLSITANPTYNGSNNHQSPYTYTYKVQYAFCNPVNGSVSVLVDEPLSVGQIEGDKSICVGNSASLSAATFNATQYRWDNGSNDVQIQVSPTTSTTYSVEMYRGKCTAKAEYELTVNSNPVIVSIDSIGIRSRHISIESGKGTAPFYYWIDNETMDENADKENLKFTKHTAYVQDAEGCSAQMEFELYTPILLLPSYFSPNGDGINDTWNGGNLSDLYPDAIVKIYDRYGKLLMESKASEESWDGTYNNKKMPASDYWYEINIAEIDKMYVGHFTLLRR